MRRIVLGLCTAVILLISMSLFSFARSAAAPAQNPFMSSETLTNRQALESIRSFDDRERAASSEWYEKYCEKPNLSEGCK